MLRWVKFGCNESRATRDFGSILVCEKSICSNFFKYLNWSIFKFNPWNISTNGSFGCLSSFDELGAIFFLLLLYDKSKCFSFLRRQNAWGAISIILFCDRNNALRFNNFSRNSFLISTILQFRRSNSNKLIKKGNPPILRGAKNPLAFKQRQTNNKFNFQVLPFFRLTSDVLKLFPVNDKYSKVFHESCSNLLGILIKLLKARESIFKFCK